MTVFYSFKKLKDLTIVLLLKNVGQFGPWMIQTLVNSDLIQTSAMVNLDSDLGQFRPNSDLSYSQFGP